MVIQIEKFVEFRDIAKNTPNSIRVQCFRDIIQVCGEIISNPKNLGVDLSLPENLSIILEICISLETHLMQGFSTVDVQFVCATALCYLINILPQAQKEIRIDIIQTKLIDYARYSGQFIQGSDKTIQRVHIMSLINGIFNSNLLFGKNSELELCQNILTISLKIVLQSCMSYSVITSMSFRNLNSILAKIVEWNIENKISGDTCYTVLVVLFNNWENPISSVRDNICKVLNNCFNLLTGALDHFLENLLLFPWNKGKYYALCELIPHLNFKELNYLFFNSCCISGLRFSLKNQNLVSAGACLYKALLNKYFTFDEWYVIFYKTFISILGGDERDIKRNLLTHWLPVTLKKHPQLIFMVMNNLMEKTVTDEVMYSFLFIMRLGRKNGHILRNWKEINVLTPEGDILEMGLNHLNDDIRAQAIQVISSYSSYTICPTNEETEIIKSFLRCNINCDSPSFRQVIVKSTINFMIILRDSFLHSYINKPQLFVGKKHDHFENFFVWIYEFLIENLVNTGNYQRKITSLQLFNKILKHIYDGSEDEEEAVAKNANHDNKQGWKVIQYLENKNKWLFMTDRSIFVLMKCVRDSARDVKEIAVDILVQYFIRSNYFNKTKFDLFTNSMALCNSRMFYDVDSGVAIFKLIVCLNSSMDCNKIPAESTNKDPMKMMDYLFLKVTEQFVSHRHDILYSIYNNMPLFGILSAMNVYLKTPGIKVERDILKKLLEKNYDIMEHILNTLSGMGPSADMDSPPSFAAIDKSINEIIKSSEHKILEDDTVQLSNAYQIIMNNIWLTLKICCELSSTLIIHHHADFGIPDLVEKCLNVNVNVLKRCRLKGAIEFAGSTLGVSIRFLTSLNGDPYNMMLHHVLNNFLNELIIDNGSSITRRSAGLSILVHRIVANDCRELKPLYYHAMDTLIKHLTIPLSTSGSVTTNRDAPRSTMLYILGRIIKESSLVNVNLKFLSQLTIICFNHIVSDHWQIRNAALQLYGSLVPRLIGQMQNQGTPGFTESPMSADEMFSHYPLLWDYIKCQIKVASRAIEPNILQRHSDLVPILSLLSNMSKRNFYTQFKLVLYVKHEREISDKILIMPNMDDILADLFQLLSSPVYMVRRLCANVIECFYSAETFSSQWNANKSLLNDENSIHGYLLLLKCYINYHRTVENYPPNYYTFPEITHFERLLHDIGNILSHKKPSYILKSLYVELLYDLQKYERIDHEKCITKAFLIDENIKKNINVYAGFYNWIDVCVYNTILHCKEHDLVQFTLKALTKPSWTMKTITAALKKRYRTGNFRKPEVVKQLILKFLEELLKKRNDVEMIDILYTLTEYPLPEMPTIYNDTMIAKLYGLFEMHEDFCYDFGYLLPLLCLVIISQFNKRPSMGVIRHIKKLALLSKKLANVSLYTAENRFFSAVSLRHLINIATQPRLNSHVKKDDVFDIKYYIISTTLNLLQDEDVEVRNECSKLTFFGEKQPTHPTRLVRNILLESFLKKYFNQDTGMILQFLDKYRKELKENEKKIEPAIELSNPFETETQNIYWEVDLVLEKISFLAKKINLTESSSDN